MAQGIGRLNYDTGLDLGEGLSTIIVCTDYCNIRKIVVGDYCFLKTSEIVNNDGWNLEKNRKAIIEPMFQQKVIILAILRYFWAFLANISLVSPIFSLSLFQYYCKDFCLSVHQTWAKYCWRSSFAPTIAIVGKKSSTMVASQKTIGKSRWWLLFFNKHGK